jgi:hypothetical protein
MSDGLCARLFPGTHRATSKTRAFSDMSLVALAQIALERNGRTGYTGPGGIAAAALRLTGTRAAPESYLTTYDFVDVLLNLARAALTEGYTVAPRYATVSATANHRYLDALAVVDGPAPAHRALDRLVQPVRDGQGRASRAFNPAALTDLTLFAAVLRGEHLLQGFRNRDLRIRLFGPPRHATRGGAARSLASSSASTSAASRPRSPAHDAGVSPTSATPR